MARKVDEATNFVFMQLIEQEPGIYGRHLADYARQNKIQCVHQVPSGFWKIIARKQIELANENWCSL
jgi:hypothetical protein